MVKNWADHCSSDEEDLDMDEPVAVVDPDVLKKEIESENKAFEDAGDDEDEKNGMDDLDELGMSKRTKEAVMRDRKKSRKDKEASEPKGSQILFWKFDSIESKRENTWSLNLPDGEEALGVSSGEGWSAVMTR